MGLLNKALAVGFGYVLAQPGIRQKLVELAQHPKVKQRRDEAQDLATNGLRAAKHRLNRSSATDTANETVPNPPYAGAPTPSPLPRVSDHAALQEGILPPAEPPSTSTPASALGDS